MGPARPPRGRCASVSALTPEQARRIYDRIGRLQDTQRFYERGAIDELIAHAALDAATSVFEFGCGTGRLAADLLARVLPADCRYAAIDVSPTMARLTADRLRPWADRASVRLSDGSARCPVPAGVCSHFVSTYVLDLLSPEAAAAVVAEAARVLVAGGRLCLVSMTQGITAPSRLLAGLWGRLWRISPGLLGGCRPVSLVALVQGGPWTIEHRRVVVRWAVASEVLVARRDG